MNLILLRKSWNSRWRWADYNILSTGPTVYRYLPYFWGAQGLPSLQTNMFAPKNGAFQVRFLADFFCLPLPHAGWAPWAFAPVSKNNKWTNLSQPSNLDWTSCWWFRNPIPKPPFGCILKPWEIMVDFNDHKLPPSTGLNKLADFGVLPSTVWANYDIFPKHFTNLLGCPVGS